MRRKGRENVRTRRILVAIDGSPESRTALEAAARLGLAMEAELSGLFIEDVELVRLAGLPFTREAGVSSGIFRRLETADIERRFRVTAEAAREALRDATRAVPLRSTFRVIRGLVIPSILEAAREADVVAAGKRSGHGPSGRRLGATARSLIAHVAAPVLIGGLRDVSAGPAVVLSAVSDVPEDARRFAALLARAFGAGEVLVIAGGGGSLRALPEIERASAVVLIRPRGAAGDELLVALAESVSCPVFVIGESGVAELLSA
jgi:nucleotide-binding universal stress UspA family protein